jgi:hypothetical protein
MEAMRAQFEREAESDGPWTSYNTSLGRPLLNSRKFLQGEKVSAAASAPGAEDISTDATAPAVPENPASGAPVLDLFSEQKA